MHRLKHLSNSTKATDGSVFDGIKQVTTAVTAEGCRSSGKRLLQLM